MTEPQIRYCTTEDGVRIAYAVEGDGPPLVYMQPFDVSHLRLERTLPGQSELYQAIASARSLIRYDPRGFGMSQRDVKDFSVTNMVRDLEAVNKEVDLGPIELICNDTSSLVGLTFAAEHPQRLRKLVIIRGFVRGASSWIARLSGIVDMVERDWPLAANTIAQATIGWNQERSRAYADLLMACVRSDQFQLFLRTLESSNVVEVLSRIACPTLVAHSTQTPYFNVEESREICGRIRGAVLAEDDPSMSQAIVRFLAGESANRALTLPLPDTQFRTILFTDIVGHTEMMQRLGDAKGRDVLREHERITRETLKAQGGAEVKTMGDGFMASFGSVTSAMECAIALQRAFAAHTESMPEPLHVRVGLNAGEPIEEDGDLFGVTVILASRIAAKAGPGEILVPDTVRGLLSGKGFVFGERGEFVPKGFDEGVRLYEVKWRG